MYYMWPDCIRCTLAKSEKMIEVRIIRKQNTKLKVMFSLPSQKHRQEIKENVGGHRSLRPTNHAGKHGHLWNKRQDVGNFAGLSTPLFIVLQMRGMRQKKVCISNIPFLAQKGVRVAWKLRGTHPLCSHHTHQILKQYQLVTIFSS